ncbi:MAG: RNA polymerase sigma factor (sigma-70 family) [Verrucomicrobiales bacterium]|jgi:RNA polymerase sigma factor (sigma-70 family)
MSPHEDTAEEPVEPAPREFATTHWSLVISAGNNSPRGREALSELCHSYWYPLYVFVRRRVNSSHDAQDLTQAFFLHLFEKHAISRADRTRGRFRAFLLTALKNFLTNEWEKSRAEKRGGGTVPLSLDFESGESRYQIELADSGLSPEKLFDRRWVLTLLDQVLGQLRSELEESGKGPFFDALKGAILGETTKCEYEEAGSALGISAAAAKQAAYRMRNRYRQLFRAEVARTLEDESDIDDEMRQIMGILSQS